MGLTVAKPFQNADYVRVSMRAGERITEHRSAVSVRRRRHSCEMLCRTGERHAHGVPASLVALSARLASGLAGIWLPAARRVPGRLAGLCRVRLPGRPVSAGALSRQRNRPGPF